MDNALFSRLTKRLDGYRGDMVKMQKELTAHPSIAPESGGKGEYARGKYLEPLLKSVFDEVKPMPCDDPKAEGGIRPNYAAKYKGKSQDRTIWIMAHMDVVPEGDLKMWDHDPFDVIEKDGKLYGRGVEDNQQAIVSGFFAIKALKDEGVRPDCNVGMLFVSDEEVTDEHGAIFVMKRYGDMFGKNDLFIVPDGGNPKGDSIEIAEKTFIWLKFITHGKQTHAAYPQNGINAHKVSAHLIVAMEELYKRYPQKNEVFPAPHCSTFEPTLKLANVQNFNTIPGEDIIGYDCRLLPSVDPNEFMRAVREICDGIEKKFGVKIDIETAGRADAAPPTPVDSPVVKLLKSAIKEINGVDARPVGESGMTVAQRFREKGLHTAVYSRIDETMHGPNEYCVIDNMINDSKVWIHVFLNA